MPQKSGNRFGWVPDLPDHRDKSMLMAGEHRKKDLASSSQGQPTQGEDEGAGVFGGDGGAPVFGRRCRTWKLWKAAARQSSAKMAPAPLLEKAFGGHSRPLLLELPPEPGGLPDSVDLRRFMSPIENQQTLGSCTANAVAGLVEYLQIATQGKYIDSSRLFLYKATRDLLGWAGDQGAYIRATIKALRLFGVCPEDYLPYDVAQFDEEPSAFCYAFAANYKALSYYRLESLEEIRRSLAQGYPVAFGFSIFQSFENQQNGHIPYPGPDERCTGSHAVSAVGYDDKKKQIVFRNSWGTDWGEEGYGFLPYAYFGDGSPANLTDDYWALALLSYEDLPNANAPPFVLARP